MATTESSIPAQTRTAEAAAKPADIKPANEFDPSGAPDQRMEVDTSHPAVDANPRANTTDEQNRIDFNDPTKSGSEVVADQLGMTEKPAADDKKD